MKVLYKVLFFVIACSCALLTYSFKEFEAEKKIKKIGTLKLPIDARTTFSSDIMQYIKNEKSLLFVPSSSNRVLMYDLDSKSKTMDFVMDSQGPNSIGGEIGGIYYHNRDSIFVTEKFTFRIFLVNSKGKIIQKFNSIEISENMPVPYGTTQNPLTFKDKKLWIAGKIADRPTEFKNVLIEYDLKANKTLFHVKAPKKLLTGNWEGTSAVLYNYNPKLDQFVIGFAKAEDVMFFDYKKSKRTVRKVKSKYFDDDDVNPFNKSFDVKAKDYVERAKYSFGQANHIGILSCEDKSINYRLTKLKSSYSDFMQGKLPQIGISVFDNQLNVLYEEKFNQDTYNFLMSFSDGNTVYIANKKAYQENDNFLTFDILSYE